MKSALFAAAAAATLLVSAPALAQDVSSPEVYGSLGYSIYDTDIGGADLGAVQGRLGARFHRNFGIEGEAAFGVDDDTIGGVDVGLNHSLAIYGVGFLPVSENLDLIARAGVGTTDVEVGGVDFDDESFNWGAGAQWNFDEHNSLRGDWTRIDSDSAEADVWSLSYVRRF